MIPFTERTLVLLKPDAVERGLIGEILGRFERAGLTIVGLKLLRATLEHAEKHYPITEVQLKQMGGKTLGTYASLGLDPKQEFGSDDPVIIGRMIHKWNSEFLSSGPVVACVLEGVHAVKKVRAIAGKTMPIDAVPGTIRGDYSSISPAVANVLKAPVRNLVHASDDENDPEEPQKEIAHWFMPDELLDYATVLSDAAVGVKR